MAACRNCGRSAGLLSNLCSDCRRELAAREQSQKEETARQADEATHRQLAERRREYIDAHRDLIRSTLEEGRTAYLYRATYVPVDSIVDSEVTGTFDIADLRVLGMSGWEIVAVIPKTIGVGLTNKSYGSTSGETWGAGLGGNVLGAYVLLRYAIAPDALTSATPLIDEFLAEDADVALVGGSYG